MSEAREDAFGDPLPEGATARLGTSRFRQPGVRSLAFSPDGAQIVSAGDGPIHIWETATGALVHNVEPGRGEQWSIAFSSAGELGGVARHGPLATWSTSLRRRRVRPADDPGGVEPGEQIIGELASYRGSSNFPAGTLGSHPSGAWMIARCGVLHVKGDQRPWRRTRLDGIPATSAAAGFGTERVAAVAERGDVRVFSAPDAVLQSRIPCGAVPTAVALSPSDGTLAAGFANGAIGLWDVSTRRQLAEWPAHLMAVSALAFSADMKILASGAGNLVRLWNPASGGERLELAALEEAPAALSFRPEAPRIVTRVGLLLQEWDAESGALLSTLPARGAWDDGSRLPETRFTVLGESGDWTLWDTATGRATLRVPAACPFAAVSPNGTLFAAIGRAGAVRMLELPSGRELWARRSGRAHITFARFLPDGSSLLVGRAYGALALLEASTGETQLQIHGPVAVSRDGTLASSHGTIGTPRQVVLHHRKSGRWQSKQLLQPIGGALRAIAFAPFHPVVAVANDGDEIRVWHLDRPHKMLARFHAPAHELVFAADGARLASVSWTTPDVLIWELKPQ